MQRNEEGLTSAEVLRARMRRVADAEGVPFEAPPLDVLTEERGRPLSVARVLRRRRPFTAKSERVS